MGTFTEDFGIAIKKAGLGMRRSHMVIHTKGISWTTSMKDSECKK